MNLKKKMLRMKLLDERNQHLIKDNATQEYGMKYLIFNNTGTNNLGTSLG
jgi:hypothetical protein